MVDDASFRRSIFPLGRSGRDSTTEITNDHEKREFLCPKITQLSDRYVGTVDKLYISNELVLDLQSAMVNINDAILDLGVLLEGGLNFP